MAMALSTPFCYDFFRRLYTKLKLLIHNNIVSLYTGYVLFERGLQNLMSQY